MLGLLMLESLYVLVAHGKFHMSLDADTTVVIA